MQRSGSADKLLFSKQKDREIPWNKKLLQRGMKREKALTAQVEL